MKYLLDTNVLIAMFRKQHGIRESILQAGIDNCFVSEATFAELKVGAYKTNDPRQWREVRETREAFGIVPITETDFDLYAQNRAACQIEGETRKDAPHSQSFIPKTCFSIINNVSLPCNRSAFTPR